MEKLGDSRSLLLVLLVIVALLNFALENEIFNVFKENLLKKLELVNLQQ